MPDANGRTRLTERQILGIMDRCGPRRDELVIGFLGLQGLRPRQVTRLRLADLDLREPALRLTTDDEQTPAAVVDMHPELRRVLANYLRYDRNAPRRDDEPVLTERPGETRPITPEQVNHVVRKVSREQKADLGVEFTVADLRWSFAMNLHEQGIDLAIIAELLGHSGPDATRRFLERGFD